jgi:hypothetical protein
MKYSEIVFRHSKIFGLHPAPTIHASYGIAPPPPPVANISGINFLGALFILKVPLETGAPQLFDASYAPGWLLYMSINSFENHFAVKIIGWSVCMEKPHLTIYWKEYMRMQSHMKFKDFEWNPVMVVKSVISQGQHDCLVMNENERQMYGLNVWFKTDRTSEC